MNRQAWQACITFTNPSFEGDFPHSPLNAALASNYAAFAAVPLAGKYATSFLLMVFLLIVLNLCFQQMRQFYPQSAEFVPRS